MPIKEKIIGLIIIIVGALPFLTRLDFFKDNSIIALIKPGEIPYQLILIILGILLVWERYYYGYRRY